MPSTDNDCASQCIPTARKDFIGGRTTGMARTPGDAPSPCANGCTRCLLILEQLKGGARKSEAVG